MMVSIMSTFAIRVDWLLWSGFRVEFLLECQVAAVEEKGDVMHPTFMHDFNSLTMPAVLLSKYFNGSAMDSATSE